MVTNNLWITTMEGPVLVRSAPLQWVKLCELTPFQDIMWVFLIWSKEVMYCVCYSSATADVTFLFTQGNFSISWGSGDSHVWKFEFSNSYIMPAIVCIKKRHQKVQKHTPEQGKKSVTAFILTMFADVHPEKQQSLDKAE